MQIAITEGLLPFFSTYSDQNPNRQHYDDWQNKRENLLSFRVIVKDGY